MPTDPRIIHQTKEAQKLVFRVATDPQRYGMTFKAISMDSAIGYDSLCDYAAGKTEMPLSALRRLCGVIPNELLSLLLDGGKSIVDQAEGIDHADMASHAVDYLAEYSAARHPESECGVDLGPNETGRLDGKVTTLRAA